MLAVLISRNHAKRVTRIQSHDPVQQNHNNWKNASHVFAFACAFGSHMVAVCALPIRPNVKVSAACHSCGSDYVRNVSVHSRFAIRCLRLWSCFDVVSNYRTLAEPNPPIRIVCICRRRWQSFLLRANNLALQ